MRGQLARSQHGHQVLYPLTLLLRYLNVLLRYLDQRPNVLLHRGVG